MMGQMILRMVGYLFMQLKAKKVDLFQQTIWKHQAIMDLKYYPNLNKIQELKHLKLNQIIALKAKLSLKLGISNHKHRSKHLSSPPQHLTLLLLLHQALDSPHQPQSLILN